MARQSGFTVENNFTRGLITESTALNFPENACTETFNCVFDETGRVTRRGEFDLEPNYSVNTALTFAAGEVFTEFVWSAAGGNGTKSFVVQQQGYNLHFYDISSNVSVSNSKRTEVYDIRAFKSVNGTLDAEDYECQYAIGNGDLVVVNRACDPILITYDVVNNFIEANVITIKYRDFSGFTYTDPYTFTSSFRPTASISGLRTGSEDQKRHFYNILNQGWWSGTITGGVHDTTNSALGQWDAARTDMPSNSDAVIMYRATETDPFDNNKVLNYSQGSTLAPKGHYILSLGEADRYGAVVKDGFTFAHTNTPTHTLINPSGGFYLGTVPVTPSADTIFDSGSMSLPAYPSVGSIRDIFDGSLSSGITFAGHATNNYFGLNLGSGKRRISKVRLDGLNATGLLNGFSNSATYSFTATTATLYAANRAPTSATDGFFLGTATDASTPGIIEISVERDYVPFQYVWVHISSPTTGNTSVTECKFYELSSVTLASPTMEDSTSERPSCTAFFAGRAWYAGINSTGLSSSIFFSQVVESRDQYGKCYQTNDPTSEIYFDILATDGGVIKIPEIGIVKRMVSFQSSMLIFASNGVWLIEANNGFSPTNYAIRKISSLGTQAGMSFVDWNGLPVWWGEDGILRVTFNPEFQTFNVEIITDPTIRSFFFAIPPENRRYVKGVYDYNTTCAYWLYDDSGSFTPYVYTKVLVLNTKSGAFYPWTISDSDPEIRGIVFAADAVGTDIPLVKYTTTINITSSTEYLTYSQTITTNPTYVDWTAYSTSGLSGAAAGDAKNYDSYFISGYRIHGDAMKFTQPNYVIVYLETETNAGCLLQGVFDFTNSTSSNKWGTQQQIYNSSLTYRDVNYRRLKVRGKGRSVQLKFNSQQGKPFTIIGWSVAESGNAGP